MGAATVSASAARRPAFWAAGPATVRGTAAGGRADAARSRADAAHLRDAADAPSSGWYTSNAAGRSADAPSSTYVVAAAAADAAGCDAADASDPDNASGAANHAAAAGNADELRADAWCSEWICASDAGSTGTGPSVAGTARGAGSATGSTPGRDARRAAGPCGVGSAIARRR